ncbi:MAG: BMP family ABC transporter substrate-binding protein [Chloroflexi bacterium]|nr:BMP family ABC transporter substrate-binding protein [Chloroflexota bacterium]
MCKRNTERLISFLGTIVILSLIAGCAAPAVSATTPPDAVSQSEVQQDVLDVALVLPLRLGDKSYLDASNEGAMRARDELGANITVVENRDPSDFEPALRSMAEAQKDITIAVFFTMIDALKVVATEYPDLKFAIIDGELDLPNVASVVFKEHEGSFLVGVVAGMMTETDIVGFVGGMDIPLIRRFGVGFEEGVKYVNPDATVLWGFVGAWDDPAKGKELAVTQFDQGADIIYAAASKSGLGTIEAAKEKGKFAIGVDSNQDWIEPGVVITSMLKRVDNAVFDQVMRVQEGTFTPGLNVYGVSNDGVGVTDFSEFRKNGPPDQVAKLDAVIAKVEEVRRMILDGTIKVTDYMEQAQ